MDVGQPCGPPVRQDATQRAGGFSVKMMSEQQNQKQSLWTKIAERLEQFADDLQFGKPIRVTTVTKQGKRMRRIIESRAR